MLQANTYGPRLTSYGRETQTGASRVQGYSTKIAASQSDITVAFEQRSTKIQ